MKISILEEAFYGSKNASMDEHLMMTRVLQVLKLYTSSKSDEVDPILLLDMYRCRMMESLWQKLKNWKWKLCIFPVGVPLNANQWTLASRNQW